MFLEIELPEREAKKRVPFEEKGVVEVLARRGEWTLEELENAVSRLNKTESRDLKLFLGDIGEYLNRLSADLSLIKRAEREIVELLPLDSEKRVSDIITHLYDSYIGLADTRLAILAIGRAFDRFTDALDEIVTVEVKSVVQDQPLRIEAEIPIKSYDVAFEAMAASMDKMAEGFLRLMEVVDHLSERVGRWTEVQAVPM